MHLGCGPGKKPIQPVHLGCGPGKKPIQPVHLGCGPGKKPTQPVRQAIWHFNPPVSAPILTENPVR